jgi:multidrug efflux pump
MSSLSTISINRPVLAIVMNLVILIFGYIGYSLLGVREFPSIDPPIINVSTAYPGANADIIQSQITEPLEKAINGIAGINNISSASNQGSSNITIEFNLSTNLEEAANDVRDKVAQAVRNLPRDLDGMPIVSKQDANAQPIIALTVRSNTRSHMALSDYGENNILPRLQTIPGVSTIQIWGQKKYAMRLWMDPVKLSSYGLTSLDVRNALLRENVELPSGKIAGNETELTIKTQGRLTTEEDFNNLVIKSNPDGSRIRFNDLGYAVLGPENEETILRTQNIPMIALAVIPQPGTNYLQISDEFHKRLKQIERDVPDDITLKLGFDSTDFIRASIKEVKETFLIALSLVILIIFFFFRNWTLAFRPLIDIPVSLLGSFFIMYILGFTINVLTLLAIILATGLVVDDGIVVTENIYKKIEKGMPSRQAAIEGSQEIFFAVISTSITLAAVFIPVIFLEGFVGALFKEFGIVLASAVLISSFVALTLTPMLNALLAKRTQKKGWFYEATEPLFLRLEDNYRTSLSSFLNYKYWSFGIIAVAMAMIYYFNGILPKELSPLEDRGSIRMSIQAPEGSSYEYTDHVIKSLVQEIVDSIPEASMVLSVTAPGFTGSGASNTGFGRLRLVEKVDRERTQNEITNVANSIGRKYTDARVFFIQEQTISSSGRLGGLPVNFVLQAPNFERLKEVLPEFLSRANEHPSLSQIDVNLKFNKPEIDVNIDREKAQVLGLSVADVAEVIQTAFSGQRFDYFTMNGKQYQVIGQFDRENRDAPADLRSIYIRNNEGRMIQLDNLATLEEVSSPPQLYHYNLYQSATVSAGLAPGRTIADGIAAMEEIASELLDDSFSTALSGASKDFAESSSNVMFAFLLALLLVYLVLAAQFESFIDPLIIMFTVPLAIAGALFSLWYFNQTLNIFSQIGIIMLIGLVTKNGILIVEFANQKRDFGLSKWDATMEGAVSRLRPILMTSLATALGALPIAMALGAGAESRKGMGVVVVGGVMLSLVLTLYVIPALYHLFSLKRGVVYENIDGAKVEGGTLALSE